MTAAELRAMLPAVIPAHATFGDLTVLDYLRAHADPLEHQTHPVIPIAHVLTPWEIRDDDAVACELIRHYSERLS